MKAIEFEPRLGHAHRRRVQKALRRDYRRRFGTTVPQVLRFAVSRKMVRFGPELPLLRYGYVLPEILVRLGLRLSDRDERRDPAGVVAWSNKTRVNPDLIKPLTACHGHVINAACLDIGKDSIDTVHEAVFGYRLGVDPSAWDGALLVKSVANAAHDGRIVSGRLRRRPGEVYQRLVDTRIGTSLYEDIRVPVFDTPLSVCMVRYRTRAIRYGLMPDVGFRKMMAESDLFAAAFVTQLSQMFSPEEVRKIERFAREIGMDYGELDVLRDRSDNRVYVVDANKTPTGPTSVLPREQSRYLMELYAEALSGMLKNS